MFSALKKQLLNVAQRAARELACPRCQHRFKPFAAGPPQTFAELARPVPCPKCGQTFRFNEVAKAATEAAGNPPGPHPKPADTRIEMSAENGAWVFHIPRTRGSFGMIIMAVFWNLVSWPMAIAILGEKKNFLHPPPLWLLPAIFPALGLGLLYVALRLKFSTHRLTLAPQTVQLRRKLILHKDRVLPVGEITGVRKKEFYQQNYRPVYGIEITAGSRRIRFGSALTEDEKNWLCWQIREFARQHGAPLGSL